MSEININLLAGESKRLLTAGKYCPNNIVVTAESGGEGDLVDYRGELVVQGGTSITLNTGVVLPENFYFFVVNKAAILDFTHSWDGTNYVYASVMGQAPSKTVDQSALVVSSDRKSITINYYVPTGTLVWVLVVGG